MGTSDWHPVIFFFIFCAISTQPKPINFSRTAFHRKRVGSNIFLPQGCVPKRSRPEANPWDWTRQLSKHWAGDWATSSQRMVPWKDRRRCNSGALEKRQRNSPFSHCYGERITQHSTTTAQHCVISRGYFPLVSAAKKTNHRHREPNVKARNISCWNYHGNVLIFFVFMHRMSGKLSKHDSIHL